MYIPDVRKSVDKVNATQGKLRSSLQVHQRNPTPANKRFRPHALNLKTIFNFLSCLHCTHLAVLLLPNPTPQLEMSLS